MGFWMSPKAYLSIQYAWCIFRKKKKNIQKQGKLAVLALSPTPSRRVRGHPFLDAPYFKMEFQRGQVQIVVRFKSLLHIGAKGCHG